MSTTTRRRGFTIRLGSFEVTKVGAPRWSPHDAYHLIMSLSWPRFFSGAVLVYVCANLVFAGFYSLGDHAINNSTGFSDNFFFSVETLATVGYGNMSPATTYGHLVATIEIITGMLSMAVITSLVFARFSKPTARLLFSKVAVIANYEGVPTLMLRVANQRNSYILEAAATVALIRDETTVDGHQLTRFHELKLERARSPIFALSWQIMHRIDEHSPLRGIVRGDLEASDMRITVTVSGTDEIFAANIHSRHQYTHENIRFGHRFVDIFDEGEHARHSYMHLDRFHDTREM